MGADAVEAPMIRIVPPDDYGPLDEACARAGTFDWIIFSSADAVDAFIDRLLKSPLDLRALGGVKLCVVGPATAERLARHGLKVDLTPAEYRAEAVIHAISQTASVRGLKILLPHADIGREVIADELRKQGAEVTEVVAYRTVATEPEREGEPDVYRMLLERRLDVVTFTSPSAVRNFVGVLGREPAADLLRTTRRRLDRAGDGGGRRAVRNPDDDHAGRRTRCRRWSTRSWSISSDSPSTATDTSHEPRATSHESLP